MGSHLATRQLVLAARTCLPRAPPPPAPICIPSSRRTLKFSLNPFRSRRAAAPAAAKAPRSGEGTEFDAAAARQRLTQRVAGGLQGSIFDEPPPDQPRDGEDGKWLVPVAADERVPLDKIEEQERRVREGRAGDGDGEGDVGGDEEGDPVATADAIRTSPDDRAAVRWHRKKVLQMVRRGSRPATRLARIARSERLATFQSPWMATSVKKLGMLARQVAGKTVEDALVQMRFSKKKFAREVAYNLREARDLATVKHGMGLGRVGVPLVSKGELATRPEDADEQQPKIEGEVAAAAATDEAGAAAPTSTPKPKLKSKSEPRSKKEKPARIQIKGGKWMTIHDPSRVYIDEAWVNRGPFRRSQLDYKARGRTGIIRPPATSISFVLKEEKTRVRIFNEKKQRAARRAPWVHLPDRPIMGQRPYFSW